MKCEQLYHVIVHSKKLIVYEITAASKEEAKLFVDAGKGKLLRVETLENRASTQCLGFVKRLPKENSQ